jgi:hypothetical protein
MEAIEHPDHWQISWDDFQKLSSTEQEQLRQRAIRESMPLLVRHLVLYGNYWLLLAGTNDCARTIAPNADQIPSDQEIEEFSRKLGCVTYGVYRSELTEEYK